MDMGAGNGAESSGKDGKNYDVWKDMEKVGSGKQEKDSADLGGLSGTGGRFPYRIFEIL